MFVLSIIFFLSLLLVLHAYFGYPLSLWLIHRFTGGKVHVRRRIEPEVTLIITAFNEEKRIGDKLENTLKLEYPPEKLQILVASDGSTDSTNEIVRSFADDGVELLEVKERAGKENAQKKAVACARGEILVFSDVATILEPRGIREIVSNFADPSVGCVSSEDRLLGRDGKPSGEGLYVRYEMWLRRLESRVNSLVGLSGSFFAARREVCQDFSDKVQSDFRTLLNSVRLGLRGVSDPESIGYYFDIAVEKKEFERKVRTVLRGLTVFFSHLEFLDYRKYGFFSYQLCCHKLLRWLVPFFLVVMFATNLLLVSVSKLFLLFFLGQLFFYGFAIYGLTGQPLGGVMKVPMFFLVVNLAIAVAWWQFLAGKRVVLWTPSER